MSYDRWDIEALEGEALEEAAAPPPPVCAICGCDIESGMLCLTDAAILALEAQTSEVPAVSADTVFATIGDGAVR